MQLTSITYLVRTLSATSDLSQISMTHAKKANRRSNLPFKYTYIKNIKTVRV